MSGIRMIDKRQNRQLHSLLGQLNLIDQKGDIVHQTTFGRTNSSRKLWFNEAQKLINKLGEERGKLVARTQRKIIHLLCLLGFITNSGQPDYERINTYVKAIGKNNPARKKLYYLSPKEMNAVCTQIQAWYKRELSSVEKTEQ